MAKVYTITNTKGGTGKTTTALHILPTMLYKEGHRNINYYQLDDNNKTDITSDAISIHNYLIKSTENAIDNVELEIDLNEDAINIIDIGGGNDTKSVLGYLKENSTLTSEDITFFIPINTNLSQQKNLKDTITLIQESYPNPKIILILNEVNDMDNYKSEFINIFGDDIYGIQPITQEIEESCQSVVKIQQDNLFQVMEYRHKTLLDGYLSALEVNANAATLKKQYATEYKEDEDIEAYYSKKRGLRFAQKVIDTVEKFPKIAWTHNWLSMKKRLRS